MTLVEHPLVGPNKVPRRLAKDGAPTILGSAPQVFIPPCPAPGRIVRRADHVREIKNRVSHREMAMSPTQAGARRLCQLPGCASSRSRWFCS
jgi:hypothetical protein